MTSLSSLTPNQLTLARMIAVPVIAVLICMQSALTGWLAFFLFVGAALTDWYDGYLARKTGQESLLGSVFDAHADKLLVMGTLMALAYNGQLAMGLIFPALTILFREVLVAGLREYVALNTTVDDDEDEAVKATKRLGTTDLARLKAALQMVALALTIPVPYLKVFHPFLGLFAGLLLWAAAALSVYTGWEYLKVVRFTPEKKPTR